MGSKIIEIFNKIVYNVLSALYQPFWAAVLLAFLTMFLYLYGKEHGWKKNNFIRNMFATWWRAFKSSSNFFVILSIIFSAFFIPSSIVLLSTKVGLRSFVAIYFEEFGWVRRDSNPSKKISETSFEQDSTYPKLFNMFL